MSLLKKLGKAAAVSALSIGLLFGNPAPKINPEKEAERYGYFILAKDKKKMFLTWERGEDPFLIGCYKMFKFGNRKFYLNSEVIWEDRNKNDDVEEEEASLRNKEYKRFWIELYKDEKKNNLILRNRNKAYYYGCIKKDTMDIKDFLNRKDTVGNFLYRLEEIREDKNKNLRFEKDESIWKYREEYEDFFDFRV